MFLSDAVNSPDASFRLRGYKYPSLVVEVALPESSKSLDALAYNYIKKSRGLIKTINGLDVYYTALGLKAKRVTISVWRPVKVDGENKVRKVCEVDNLVSQIHILIQVPSFIKST